VGLAVLSLAGVLGFATVGVNMRGTGCSGGAYDFFEPLQLLDGYDIIETVATQEWAYKVGMDGISFPGISQLFVGGARPPHLAAITPFSVIADIYSTPGFPGGIFNNGFAQSWLQERKHDAGDPETTRDDCRAHQEELGNEQAKWRQSDQRKDTDGEQGTRPRHHVQ